MNVVSGTMPSGRWGHVPSQGHMALWFHPWSVFPPQGSGPSRSCVLSKRSWSSPGAQELQESFPGPGHSKDGKTRLSPAPGMGTAPEGWKLAPSWSEHPVDTTEQNTGNCIWWYVVHQCLWHTNTFL